MSTASEIMAAAATRATMFRPATRQKCRLRMAIDGVSGSGKTFTALRFAFAFGQRVAVINAESGAVEKYLGLAPDGIKWQFDICELQDFAPTSYTTAILTAGQFGYDVVIIDSLSHAWAGSGGALEIKDKKAEKNNAFTAWRDVTPMHNRMVESILRSPCHVIATMRSKTSYVLQTDERGKQVPVKVGMEPIQRPGMEYEFDIYASIDSDHILKVSKSRCPEMTDAVAVKPGMDFIRPAVTWVNDGSDIDKSFFAVTEDDLRKLDKASHPHVADAPKKSAQELMHEAAQRAQVTAATQPPAGTQSATTTSPGQTAEEYATHTQMEQIKNLFSLLGIDADTQQAILQKKGVNSLRSLTQQQAGEMLAKLQVKAAELAKQAESQQSSGAGQGLDVSHATSMQVDGPCTADQVATIKTLITEIEQLQPGTADKVKAKLVAVGLQKIVDLTFNEARTLEQALRVKNMEAFFAAKLQGFKPGN